MRYQSKLNILVSIFALLLFAGWINLYPAVHKGLSADKNNRLPAKIVKISDGDTLFVEFDGVKQHVRLIGVDAPESFKNPKAMREIKNSNGSLLSITELGREATKYLRRLLKKDDVVYLEFDLERKDRFDRLLAYVYLPDGAMLNEKILRDGFGLPMRIGPNIRYQDLLQEAYYAARREKVGFWRN